MKLWQNISWIETDQLIEVATFAEAVGFDGVMDGDHVAFPEPLRSSYLYTESGKRMGEMIVLMRKLWMGGRVEHRGDFFDIPALYMEPSPKRLVPVYGGGTSKPALRRAATLCDGWFNAANAPEELPALMAELTRMRKEMGRDHLRFETTVALTTPPAWMISSAPRIPASTVSWPTRLAILSGRHRRWTRRSARWNG